MVMRGFSFVALRAVPESVAGYEQVADADTVVGETWEQRY